MKIGICTDSGSGIRKEESEKFGITVVPMPFRMGDQEYFEGINMSRELFFEKLAEGEEVSTSQPSMESLMKAWDALLLENDEIVHVPLSSGLSGSTQTALMLSQEEPYLDRVFVSDSRGVSVTQRMHCLFAKELAEKGYTGKAIQHLLNSIAEDNGIYIGVSTLKYLKRGGRITTVAAAIGSLLQIKPVLSINKGGKLDSFKKVRTERQVREAIIEGLKDSLERLGDPEARKSYIAVAYTDNLAQAEEFRAQLMETFPNRYEEEIVISPLSLLISCHIGENGLGAAVIKRPDALENT